MNGQVVRELGTKVDPSHDHVKVNGHHLKPAPPQTFIMLNKPKGHVCSLSDPLGRPTLLRVLRGVRLRVFPVGRLDYDSEGLVLLTNDGDLAERLLHPRYHVPKSYLIKVKGVLTDDEIVPLEEGVQLDDGLTGPARVKKIRKAEENSWLEVTISEGRKHQVKRMLEAVGHPVLKLTRVRFGPLVLGHLSAGEFRYLTDREANALRQLAASGHVPRTEFRASSPRPGLKKSRTVAPKHSRIGPPKSKVRTRISKPAPRNRSPRRRAS